MKRTLTGNPDSFWTTWSLRAPVAEGVQPLGPHSVSIWANTADAVSMAKDWLQSAHEQSNAGEIRVIVKSVVDHAETEAIPLACHILGKG